MSKNKRVRISNSSINCYGSRVLTSGVNIEQYQKNPVLLYMHRRGEVIGLVRDIRIEGDDITGEPWFDEVSEESKLRKQQWEAGSLKMVSANFDILALSEEKEDLLPGQYRPTVTKSKLVEVSIVDIGGNDDALVLTHKGQELKLAAGEDNPNLPLLNTNQKEENMDFKAIALKLGLPETATEADILTAIGVALGYKTEAETLRQEKDALQLSAITQAVDKAVSDKKITADKKGHFIELGKSVGMETLTLTFDAMSASVKPSAIVNGGMALSVPAGGNKKWGDYSEQELITLRKDQRDVYIQLFKQEYGIDPVFDKA